MSAVASETAVVNGALAYIRQPPLASLNDATHAARVAALRLPVARDALLASHRWNFAENPDYVPAASSLTANARGYYRHLLDPAVLVVVDVPDLSNDAWQVVSAHVPGGSQEQGRVLLAKTLAPRCIVTLRIVDPALWSPLFREVMEIKLAAALADPVIGDSGRGEELEALAERRLRRATRRDAQEGPAGEVVASVTPWIASRRGSGRRF